MRNIIEALGEHFDKVLEYGISEDQILGIFLCGSQNYNVATESSDVDTKCIIIPTFEQCVLEKPIVKELHLENGEHCDVMDIHHFVDSLKKQNINFLEVLFTDYGYVNRKYADDWHKYFIDNREDIAWYDPYKAVQSMCGQAIHALKKDPHNGKKVGNAYRIFASLSKYLCGKQYYSYKNCITMWPDIASKIKSYKQSNFETTKTADTLLSMIEGYQRLPADWENFKGSDKEKIDKMMNDGIMSLVRSASNSFLLS